MNLKKDYQDRMEDDILLQQLESLIHDLSIKLRYEKGDFQGGLCKVNGEKIFIVNKKLPTERKIKIFAEDLSQLDLDNIFMVPAVRKIIDEVTEQSTV